MTICFENVVKALDIYSQKNDKFVLCGDLNSEHTESSLSEFLVKYGWKNLFWQTLLRVFTILTALKISFLKSAPKKILHRNYKTFNTNSFKSDLKKQLKYTASYESFENVFLNVLQRHAPLKTKVVRENHPPYMNKTLRKAIIKRSELDRKYL